MPESPHNGPTFNLWRVPWIGLEDRAGHRSRAGIEQTLLHAHELAVIHDVSPLVMVGIYRLLVAVLQAAFNPTRPPDLQQLWRQGRFPDEPLLAFGLQYSERFDLFSPDKPYLQSADLLLQPARGDKTKTVAYLAPEIPAGTNITHYHHGAEDTRVFCPACAAGGLALLPAFATSGGAGIKPSINGVPPIYMLPGGATLFESLARSLLLPEYQPAVRSVSTDRAWWQREPLVRRGQEVAEVGYLHSLTFPARRVRLHPEPLGMPCSRCGEVTPWGVRTMIFEMGECRPDGAPAWFDPFAAYRLPTDKKPDAAPTPIRPRPGHALWREYGSLLLMRSAQGAAAERSVRPSVLDQLSELGDGEDMYAIRCVGLRTDMKGKVFEWVEAGFEVPPALLRDPAGGDAVSDAMRFAGECAEIIRTVFRTCIRGASLKSERHRVLRERMSDELWAALAGPFRAFVSSVAVPQQQAAARREWMETALRAARSAFRSAASAVGDDATSLRQRVRGETLVDIRLAKKRKEYLDE